MRRIAAVHLKDDHGSRVFAAGDLGALHIDIIDRRLFSGDRSEDLVQICYVREFHVDGHIAEPPLKGSFQRKHHIENDDQDDQDDEHAVVHAGSAGKTHAGAAEQAGCRCQARDLLMSGGEDGTRSQKADAADDLGRVAGRVKFHTYDLHKRRPLPGHHLVLVACEQHGHGGTDRGQDVGAKTGVLLLFGTADPDDGPAGNCQNEPHQNREKVEFFEISKKC